MSNTVLVELLRPSGEKHTQHRYRYDDTLTIIPTIENRTFRIEVFISISWYLTIRICALGRECSRAA